MLLEELLKRRWIVQSNPILEDTEQKILVQYLRLKKIFHFSPINENQGSSTNRNVAIRVEAKAKSMGKLKGVSDLVVFMPKQILFIELKRAKKVLKSGKLSTSHTKVSDEQKSFLKRANEFPYAKGYVCYGAEEAIKIIEANK